jgi:EAL domain-containing protein (putative c-di-GMP-specific phosphodiesterase class I)
VFESHRQQAALQAAELEANLRDALKAGGSGLMLHYQPIQDTGTDRVVGAEALVRWQHPTRGLVGPPEFIPLAEHCGLITGLDRFVLARALEEVRDWDGWVSVNVSPQSMGDPDWPGYVRGELQRLGFPAERLVLEATERTVLDTQRALENAVELARSGVRIALDDFGTGYSSLAQLAQLPVHLIKIDHALVHTVQAQPRNAAIVKAILALAGHLELGVVAEGVETAADLHWLRDNHCSLVQGFFLGRPTPWRTGFGAMSQ